MEEPPIPLSGRRAQAARNDQGILDAARAVFVSDPEAPISAVAERAGVGISALYRRYRSKEDLLRQVAAVGLQRYLDEVEAALVDEREPWLAFCDFMRRVVDADTHSSTLRLAGTFTPTEQLWRDGERGRQLNVRLLERTKAAGALRPDLQPDDLSLLFGALAAIRIGDEQRTAELRRRYLALMLDALHTVTGAPLPGTAPTWQEISGRWGR